MTDVVYPVEAIASHAWRFEKVLLLLSLDQVSACYQPVGLDPDMMQDLVPTLRRRLDLFYEIPMEQRGQHPPFALQFLELLKERFSEKIQQAFNDWLFNTFFCTVVHEQVYLYWHAALANGFRKNGWSKDPLFDGDRQAAFEKRMKQTVHYRTVSPIDEQFMDREDEPLSDWDLKWKGTNAFGDQGEPFDSVATELGQFHQIRQLRRFFSYLIEHWSDQELERFHNRTRQLLEASRAKAFMAGHLVSPQLIAKPMMTWPAPWSHAWTESQ